jgi:hypothetical protein
MNNARRNNNRELIREVMQDRENIPNTATQSRPAAPPPTNELVLEDPNAR